MQWFNIQSTANRDLFDIWLVNLRDQISVFVVRSNQIPSNCINYQNIFFYFWSDTVPMPIYLAKCGLPLTLPGDPCQVREFRLKKINDTQNRITHSNPQKKFATDLSGTKNAMKYSKVARFLIAGKATFKNKTPTGFPQQQNKRAKNVWHKK